MALLAYTNLDAKQALYILLHGQKFAETDAGTAVIQEAINRAQAEVLVKFGSLGFAGACAQSTALSTLTNGMYSFSASNVLVPIAVEVLDSATPTYATAAYVTPSRFYRLSRGARATKEYQYTFVGMNVAVRPTIPTGGSIILQNIKQPIVLAADADALEADCRLFRAIAIRGAWNALQKFPSVDIQRLQQLASDLDREYASLDAQIMRMEKEEFEGRTGIDLTFGGKAPGQGG